ncbi:hypothetical protein HXS80_33640 [Streptomyces sp. CB04723]|uniref:hypothetical protein n=1 Tax=Streptomyces TaxID=1883 RepID=UPI0015C43278|nr:hypothetical protein [Streptomyces sp. CB04723]QLG36047.1 hypothetical protein HXS80_33640 [Streptomyces sp. CB04723]
MTRPRAQDFHHSADRARSPRRREPKRSATAPAIGTTSGDLADPRRIGRPAVTAGTAIGKTPARTRAEAARIAETDGRL